MPCQAAEQNGCYRDVDEDLRARALCSVMRWKGQIKSSLEEESAG